MKQKTERLRRSLAWATALKPDELRELIAGPSDCIVLDLEDGIPVPLKPEARRLTREILENTDFRGKERIVRVNTMDSVFFPLDMEEVIGAAPPDAVRVPMCERPEELLRLNAMLAQIEEAHGLARNSIEVLAMIESPLGVRNAYDIITSCHRITALSIGMEDMCREYGVRRRYEDNALDMLYLRQKLVLDSKAAGAQMHDSVLLVMGDVEATRREAEASRQMGYTGRSVHGNEQAALANAVYSPDPAEVEESRAMVETYEKASASGQTESITYGGKLICYAAYVHAKDIVAMDEKIRAKG